MGNIIALCAHGPLAPAMLDAAAMIAGVPEGVHAFPLLEGQDPFEYRTGIASFLNEHPNDGCLLLADLFGGTPSNMCATLSACENVEVVAGVNLAMLIEVMTRKDQMPLSELRDLALRAAGLSAVDAKKRFADTLTSK